MIKIDFEIAQHGQVFRDALRLPEDHGLSGVEIDEMKQARFDAWYAYITNPPAPADDEPVPDEELEG